MQAVTSIRTSTQSSRRVFWAAVWLAIVLVATKAYYLGMPGPTTAAGFGGYLESLAAISYGDILFAMICWAAARTILAVAGLSGRRDNVASAISIGFVACAAVGATYAAI